MKLLPGRKAKRFCLCNCHWVEFGLILSINVNNKDCLPVPGTTLLILI